MPNINKTGDLTVVTISEDEERKLKQFEEDAIKANLPVIQHGAAMIEKQPPLSPLTLYRLMKRITGQTAESSIIIPEVQSHSASTSTSSTNNTTNTNNTNNIVLLKLMKKIANSASPFSI